jgi:hypothetical protein
MSNGRSRKFISNSWMNSAGAVLKSVNWGELDRNDAVSRKSNRRSGESFSAVKCYPCREVTLNYNRSLLFHGGDAGSIPVPDAKAINHLQRVPFSPRIQ